MNTLSISKDSIYGALNQHSDGALTPSKQGRQYKHKKVKETVVQDVCDHINSFAAIDSHYCRARKNKKYLDASLSVAKVYRLYEEAYKEHERAPLDKYRRIFEEEFNFAFHKHKKDQCEICTSQRNNATDEEKESFEEHLSNKLKAREIKEQEKLAAKTPFRTSCAFDMEQILLCPHGQSSSFYYKRRLGVYNFTTYDYKNGDGLCHMWPESKGRRGPNEVASYLFDYMKERSLQSVKEIHMFPDNCGGQNRNRYEAFALWFARNHLSLSKITHTFLEKGHAETENDSFHATIERATRRLELYTPDQWYTAVRAATVFKQPYKVKQMTAKDFVDFKSMSNNVTNWQLMTMGRKLCGAESGSFS
ncbi:DNA repair protein rhp54 [Plakobranchus ocellatus]|uniref:DNA repair protein rhp54 n=1 Tax=Plakobranchus ocellatus TaxID=259542 RepID=A0AAV3YPU3_9GAST|nr:DNA repair protein rhp54 [Plakobranchus ocellatus]